MARIILALIFLALAYCANAEFTLDSGYPAGGSIAAGAGEIVMSGNTVSGVAMGAPCELRGPVNYSWTWQGPSPRPTYAIITVTAKAGWVGTGGSCANGLLDPEVGYPPPPLSPTSGTAQGTHYVLKTVTSSTVTYSVDPSTSCDGDVDFVVTATITPITLDLLGPTDSKEMAIGQLLEATVNAHGLERPGDTYTWEEPAVGHPFADYRPDVLPVIFTAFSVPPTTSKKMECYFAAQSWPTIRCTYHSALLNQDITLSVQIRVLAPQREPVVHKCGTMKLLSGPSQEQSVIYQSGGPDPSGFYLWNSTFENHTWGIWQGDVLTDPSCVASGTGVWAYIQTLFGQRIINPTDPYTVDTKDLRGLDKDFPYPAWRSDPAWQTVNGLTRKIFSDSPGKNGLSPYPYELLWDVAFSLYILYKPPASAAGPSVAVPFRLFPWGASGTCSAPQPSGPWYQQDNGSGFGEGIAFPWPFPSWSSIYIG